MLLKKLMTNPQQMLADLEWLIDVGADEVIGETANLAGWKGLAAKAQLQSKEPWPSEPQPAAAPVTVRAPLASVAPRPHTTA
ncbi:MAG: hypothetical protein WCD70_06850, partial [Alphaproteobacteria bacterium]